MDKIKPASPLPWTWLPDEGQFIVNEKRDIIAEVPCQGAHPEDGAYIASACNAYPKLVEALRDAGSELALLYAHAITTGIHEAETPPHKVVEQVLRELGEA